MGTGTIRRTTQDPPEKEPQQNLMIERGKKAQDAKKTQAYYRYDPEEEKKQRKADTERIAMQYALETKKAEEIEKVTQNLDKKREKEQLKDQKELAKQQLLDDAALRESQKKALKEYIKENKKATKEQLTQEKERLKELEDLGVNKDSEEYKAQEARVEEAQSEAKKASLEEFSTKLVESVDKALTNLTNKMDTYIEKYESYYGSINARIQDAYEDMDFKSLSSDIQKVVAYSPYVKYVDILDSLNTLVEAGTAYNLTQRAFLDSISDKIATTFDATDSTLLRIVRLQQSDTTASRLGMEASLTRLFNYYFSDTSYLSDAFDSVTQALLGLTSSLDAQSGVEYEYVIQKWLGALGSEGADSSTLTSLAEAINALSIGDISTLQSNQGMENLLIMSANRMGLDFSDMLVNTPTANELNTLMYGVIDYIQEIMEGANNVVKNQYAGLFGITYTDIQAFMNLNDEVLAELYSSAMTYNDTLEELDYQLGQVGKNRIPIATMIGNVLDNVMAEAALTMFNSRGAYTTYAIAEALEGITGGIQIPILSTMGNSVTIPNSVEELMKIGVTGYGLLGSLTTALTSFATGASGVLDLANWNISYEKGAYTGYTSAAMLTTSKSNVGTINNANTTGIQQSMYDEQKASAEEISGVEADQENEVVTAIDRVYDFLSSGGSETNPFNVTTSYGQSGSGVRTLSSSSSGDYLSIIVQGLQDILTRLNGSPTGYDSSTPIYTYNTSEAITTSSLQEVLERFLPKKTL